VLQRAVEIRQKNMGSAPLDYALCLEKVARLYRVMGKYAESERMAKRSLQIYMESLGVDYPAIEQHNTCAIVSFRFVF
jgi:hypothetical protein